MTLAEQIAEVAAALPTDRQREVLDFAEFLKSRAAKKQAGERRAGLFAGLPYTMADDFDEPLPDSFWTGKEQ
jgi:hypothetical protein